MKQPVFEGTCTALITPFAEHQINYELFDTLLARQIQAGVSAVAVCATTGEAATMSDREQTALIAHCVAAANGACKVIAGTGTNDTVHAIEKSKAAEAAGADALLVVTPYYNKCNSDGLLRHYTALADAVHIPVILYNVPSRTGVYMTPSQYAALAKHPNIAGVKEACGNIAQVSRTIALCGPDFPVWSGNDDQNVPILALGGRGVISVLSNLAPELVCQMTDACLAQDYPRAAKLQNESMDLIDALFSEVNPIPIKAAMCLAGFPVGPCRLPLGEMSAPALENLRQVMHRHGLC